MAKDVAMGMMHTLPPNTPNTYGKMHEMTTFKTHQAANESDR